MSVLYGFIPINDGLRVSHSGTSQEGQRGEIQLNQTERLTIDDMRFALKKAIGRRPRYANARGLQLAIFNSCDGLGLASEKSVQNGEDLSPPKIESGANF
ncbi:MAG: hypothetical protein F6K44_33750 [Moorea sp. SIO3E2]|nr:hypothetical protein [Moorena sp. SIO3E2]